MDTYVRAASIQALLRRLNFTPEVVCGTFDLLYKHPNGYGVTVRVDPMALVDSAMLTTWRGQLEEWGLIDADKFDRWVETQRWTGPTTVTVNL